MNLLCATDCLRNICGFREQVNALPEEMVNPQRDLPIAVWIAMTLVTAIYVLTNSAYFAVLTPEELLSSDAVALVSVVFKLLMKIRSWDICGIES